MASARTLDHLASDPAGATFADPASIRHDQTLRPPMSTGSIAPSALPSLPLADLPGDDVDLVLGAPLGEGGMGVVFVARQVSLDREVVVKRVRPGAPARAAEALVREARVAGGLEHPNIVPVHALGLDPGGEPALVMKRIDGVAWGELIRGGQTSLTRHLEILGQVCNAIHYAHDRGVLHRDLKPDNVMIGRFGEVLVVDWGVAARLEPGARTEAVAGTPAYMAPEMLASGAPISPATDVYLLGGCLHHVLTGQAPHQGETLDEVFASVQASRPRDYGPDVPPELASVVHRALSADPAGRYPSAGELGAAIAWYLRHEVSIALAGVARERWVELRGLLASADPPVQRVEELFTEARFGFRQALETCGHNPAAQGDLQDMIRAMVAFKLAHDDLGGADGLLPQLTGDTAALRDDLARRRREEVAAHDLAHDLDPLVGARQRLASIGALFLFFTVVTLVLLSYSRGEVDRYGPKTAFQVAIVTGGMVLAILFLLRKALYNTRFNRAVANSAALSVFAVVLNRGYAWHAGVAGPAMLADDLLIIAVIIIGMIGQVSPPLALVGVPYLLGSVLTSLFPTFALPIFGLSGLTGVGSLAVGGWWLWARPVTAAEPPSR